MRRLGPIAVAIFFAVNAGAECKGTPAINELFVDGVSHGLWRGIDLGGRIFIEPRLEVGLCGHEVSKRGLQGADLTVEGWVPISNGGTGLASLRARYLWYMKNDNDQETFVAAGLRETHWDSGPRAWTSEASVEFQTKLHLQSQGINSYFPFVEVARDLNRFKATYARAGIHHKLVAVSVPVELETTGFISASDYSDHFGWHSAEVAAWLYYRSPDSSKRVGVGGGYDRVSSDIGRSRAWLGVRVNLFHS